MPLSVKLRIEIYIPCLPNKIYKVLLNELQEELTYSFGGCSVLEKIDGSFLSSNGQIMLDVVNVVYTDINLSLNYLLPNSPLDIYCTALIKNINNSLNEEAILIAIHPVYHAE